MEINEKKLEEILKGQRGEYQRYFDVLKEDFDSKVQLIVEQYDSIIDRLDSHEKNMDSYDKKMDSHEKNMDSQNVRLVSIEKNIEIMKVDIVFIKNSLKRKVDIEEFDALERRVAILEAKKAI